MAEYRAMSAEERRAAYAGEIGGRIGDWLDEVVYESLPGSDSFPEMLIRELLPSFTGSDLTWALGEHYMPEPDDMEGGLDEEDEDDEDDPYCDDCRPETA